MSWKCDICDSYNEESSQKCYVCGQPRSIESIIESKWRKRKERNAHIKEVTSKTLYAVLRALFILGLSISLIVIVVILIIKIIEGSEGDIWQITVSAVQRAYLRLGDMLDNNLKIILSHITSGFIKNFTASTEALQCVVSNNTFRLSQVLFFNLPNIVRANILNCFSESTH